MIAGIMCMIVVMLVCILMVDKHICRPCKPDIFEQTYEAVE